MSVSTEQTDGGWISSLDNDALPNSANIAIELDRRSCIHLV